MPKDKQTGHHYDRIVHDDLISMQKTLTEYLNLRLDDMLIRGNFAQMISPGLHSIFSSFYQQYVNEREKWSPEEMAKQVELYRNIIETKYGVKLCVKRNINSDITSMELLVPNKLFANDDGRESLADALQNIAMFVLNMENPDPE